MSETEILTPLEVINESALVITTTGAVQVVGLDDEVKKQIAAGLVSLDLEVKSESDLAEAKKNVALSAETEKMLTTGLEAMISGQKGIAEASEYLKSAIGNYATSRLSLFFRGKAYDKTRKKEITDAGKARINKRLACTAVAHLFSPQLNLVDQAIKSKRSYGAMEVAVSDAVIEEITRLAWFERQYINNICLFDESTIRVPSLKYPDKKTLLLEETDKLALIIKSRETEQLLALKEEADRVAAKKIEDDLIAKEKAEAEADRLAKIEAEKLAEAENTVEVIKPEPAKVTYPSLETERAKVEEVQPKTFSEPPPAESSKFSTPPPIATDKTYTITFKITGSESRRDEIVGRLKVAQGVSAVTVD